MVGMANGNERSSQALEKFYVVVRVECRTILSKLKLKFSRRSPAKIVFDSFDSKTYEPSMVTNIKHQLTVMSTPNISVASSR
jgi:hypothetical protein